MDGSEKEEEDLDGTFCGNGIIDDDDESEEEVVAEVNNKDEDVDKDEEDESDTQPIKGSSKFSYLKKIKYKYYAL